jgi:hypothetical protein
MPGSDLSEPGAEPSLELRRAEPGLRERNERVVAQLRSEVARMLIADDLTTVLLDNQ